MKKICQQCGRFCDRSPAWFAARGDRPVLHPGRCEDAWRQEQRELDAEEARAKRVLSILGEPS